MKFNQKNQGFTLIELILYIAIVSFVLLATTTFAWNIMGSQTQLNVSSETTQSARIVLENISTELNQAQNFEIEENSLILDGAKVRFKLEEKTVQLASAEEKSHKLMLIKEDKSIELNSDKVDIQNFKLSDLSRDGKSKAFKLELSLNYLNPGMDTNRNKTLSINTAFTLSK